MKRFVFGFAVVSLLAVAAVAGKQQLVSTYYRLVGGTSPFYGRTDGIVVGTRAKEIKVVNNGELIQDLGKAVYEDFTTYSDGDSINCQDNAGTKGACAGNAALAECLCTLESGMRFLWVPLDQQDIEPDMDAGSLDVGSDQTDNDAFMLVWGMNGASGGPFFVGKDPAFHMCTEFAVADITGIDQNIMAGFVELAAESWNADFEALNSYAGIGILGTAAAGVTSEDVTIKTEDDGAGVTTTDTTDDIAEGTKHKLCTYVNAAGVVTYTVNGAAPTVTAAFTLDDGIAVVPFITAMHTNDVAGEIDLYTVEIAYDE